MSGKARFLAPLLAVFWAGQATANEIGDAEAGAEVFELCSGCHEVGKGAANSVGPHLNSLFGRKAAGLEAFNYSKSLQRAGNDGLFWTLDKLDAYLTNPRILVSGTRMNFDGLEEKTDRDNVLAYLRIYSDNPSDIPEAEPTARPSEIDLPPEILAIKGDRDYGEYLSNECKTCHQIDGSDQGIPSIRYWPAENFVLAMHAYKQKVRPHPVMQMMAGRLSDEEIAALAAYFGAPD